MSQANRVFAPLAEDYAHYRPGYPAEVLDVLTSECGLTRDWLIADIGSGTGNLARLFLAAGYKVVGVEPNREMREAGERLLSGYTAFRSIDGAAESMPLDTGSVEMITVGQALHWFDVEKARAEFERILRPGGWIAVLWNDRLSDTTAFTREYDAITSALADEHPSPCTSAPSFSAGLDRLVGSAPYSAGFPHSQSFDLNGLLGRARSSGYIPQPGAPGYTEITALVSDLFARHQHEGIVDFHYMTRLFVGHLPEDSR
jgi:SAM-dependent methyltransferase